MAPPLLSQIAFGPTKSAVSASRIVALHPGAGKIFGKAGFLKKAGLTIGILTPLKSGPRSVGEPDQIIAPCA